MKLADMRKLARNHEGTVELRASGRVYHVDRYGRFLDAQ